MPKLPFTLFDFKNIDYFGPKAKKIEAAAGAAIPETVVYKCPDHKFTLLLQANVASIKVTSTEFTMAIIRADIEGVSNIQDWLMVEDLGTTEGGMSWPMQKAATGWVLGWGLAFLFPGDEIRVSHALTALETIVDRIGLIIIEYEDPRWHEK